MFVNLKMEIYFDGASRGNPGMSGCASIIYLNGIVYKIREKLGICTNNYAEYSGLLIGLKYILENKLFDNIKSIKIFGDSMLVINQLNGLYKCNSPNIKELYKECMNIILELKKQNIEIELIHIYRSFNKIADEEANIAIEY